MNLIDNRQIRVFISSTFQDMQGERNYLMKYIFPVLRRLAAERDVTLTEIDLRWGITEEEAKMGKVVEICLCEIENSIPFFIGIIGNRYGWVPEKKDISENVTDRFKDVNKYLEHRLSVTEMEMQFGVLQRKEDMHAYFYIKEGEEKENADNPEMLERLKKEVKASRYPSSTYSSPENLGIQVQQAFTSLLDQIFPGGQLSPLEKERVGQRSFMNQLCQNYIRDGKNFLVLDEWLSDWKQHQLVVTGASGLGKSALIANWLKAKLTEENRCYNIIYHFTGNGGSESSHEYIMKVLIDEINDVYGWDEDNNTGKSLNDKLNKLFVRVAYEGKKPLLIVLDAINQIVDTDNAKLLNWLPIPPKNIKILFSTLENDHTMEVFKNRHYPVFVLQPISLEHRKKLVAEYLEDLFGKKLTDAQVEVITTDKQCENTLVLKTLLDELINFGVYEKLDERIKYYLSQDTIEEFYQALLKRFEEDFGKDFICHVLSLIALSQYGLTENSLMEIINETKTLHWSQFYCSFINHLVNKNGIINFSHEYIRKAINSKYMIKEWEKLCRYDILSFRIHELENNASVATFSEIAFQLYFLDEDDELYNWLCNLSTLSLLYYYERQNVIRYWERLLSKGYNMDVYKTADDIFADNQHKTMSMVMTVLSFFNAFGRYDIECALAEKHLQILMADENISTKIKTDALNNLGKAYYNLDTVSKENEKYYQKSFNCYLKANELAETINYYQGIIVAYNGCADLCLRAKKSDMAIDLSNIALELSKKHCQVEIPMCLNNLAQAHDLKKEWNQAILYYKKCIEIIRDSEGSSSERLAIAYYNLTNSYYRNKHYKEAFDSISEAIIILKKIYENYHDIDSYIKLQNEIKKKL